MVTAATHHGFAKAGAPAMEWLMAIKRFREI